MPLSSIYLVIFAGLVHKIVFCLVLFSLLDWKLCSTEAETNRQIHMLERTYARTHTQTDTI